MKRAAFTMKLKDRNASDQLASTKIVKKWGKHMADLMETNPDKSPVTVNLTEVFHME